MADLIKIAVDAMGGDGSPKKIIDGIILNHKSNKENFFRIFGDISDGLMGNSKAQRSKPLKSCYSFSY